MIKRRKVMTIKEFCEAYNAKRFMNTKQGVDERFEWIKSELGIKEYVPFREKRKIAEMIVAQNIEEVDGVKKYDSIDGYVSLIVASIASHTNLEFGEDPIAEYDLLAESGLLPQIIAQFQGSHDEIDIILKMALAMELEDNNTNALVGRFLNKILGMLDGVGDVLKEKLDGFDLSDVLGADFNKEDLAKLSSFLNKFN
jgi:hypothetical protein